MTDSSPEGRRRRNTTAAGSPSEATFDDHDVFWYIRDGDETVGFCAARVEGTMFQINKM